MDKKEFDKLIKNKKPQELHRIISRSCNGIINLTTSQTNKVINLKNRLLDKEKEKRV